MENKLLSFDKLEDLRTCGCYQCVGVRDAIEASKVKLPDGSVQLSGDLDPSHWVAAAAERLLKPKSYEL